MAGIGVTEVIIIVVAVTILFGAKRIPEFARSLGTGLREFKDSVTSDGEAGKSDSAGNSSPAEKNTKSQ